MKNLEKFFGTQKQWFCVVILALVCAGTAFSQQPAAEAPAAKEKKNAITLDLMPLFKGILMSDQDANMLFIPISLAYERLLFPHFSIVPNLDIYFGKVGEDADGDNIPYIYFSIVAEGRYYITEQMNKFFIGAMFGFNVQAIDGKTKTEYGGFVGPLIGLKAGYKLIFGKMFFVEPSMAYVYEKNNGGPTPLGWQAGLRLGVQF